MVVKKKATQKKIKSKGTQKIKLNNPQSQSEVITKVKGAMKEIEETKKPVQSEERDNWGAIGLEKISLVLGDVLDKKPLFTNSIRRKRKKFFSNRNSNNEKIKTINERLSEDMKSLHNDINQLMSDIELVEEEDINWGHLNKNQNAFKAIAEMVFDDDPQGKNHPAYSHYLRLLKNLEE